MLVNLDTRRVALDCLINLATPDQAQAATGWTDLGIGFGEGDDLVGPCLDASEIIVAAVVEIGARDVVVVSQNITNPRQAMLACPFSRFLICPPCRGI